MIRFSKLFFGFTVFVLLLWLLPWAYNFAFYKPERTPFTLWSCVVGDFAVVDFAGDGIVRTYTDREFDSILPTFYARQLLNDERFPDSLCGVAVTPRLLQSENFMFRSTPAEINKPRTGLYPLLESMSGRVDLEMPDDVFRITSSGIEFVVMATNRIDRGKSDRFRRLRWRAIRRRARSTTKAICCSTLRGSCSTSNRSRGVPMSVRSICPKGCSPNISS